MTKKKKGQASSGKEKNQTAKNENAIA